MSLVLLGNFTAKLSNIRSNKVKNLDHSCDIQVAYFIARYACLFFGVAECMYVCMYVDILHRPKQSASVSKTDGSYMYNTYRELTSRYKATRRLKLLSLLSLMVLDPWVCMSTFV